MRMCCDLPRLPGTPALDEDPRHQTLRSTFFRPVFSGFGSSSAPPEDQEQEKPGAFSFINDPVWAFDKRDYKYHRSTIHRSRGEMADAYGSGPYGETHGGSTPLVSNSQ